MIAIQKKSPLPKAKRVNGFERIRPHPRHGSIALPPNVWCGRSFPQVFPQAYLAGTFFAIQYSAKAS